MARQATVATVVALPTSKHRPIRFQDGDKVIGLTDHAAHRFHERNVSMMAVAKALRPHNPDHYRARKDSKDAGHEFSGPGGVTVIACRAGDGGWTVLSVWKEAAKKKAVPRRSVGKKTTEIHLEARYERGATLGRGGMSYVYHAVHRSTREAVALKQLAPGVLVSGTRMKLRFQNEIEILDRCRGPHILHLVCSGTFDGDPAYVAELCQGSLFDLARDQRLKLTDTLRYAVQTLIALDRVHAFGAVHRDIKPSNLLIGMDGAIRLADFGVAHHPRMRLTTPGTRVGTPAFRPAGDSGDDPTVDTFALGVLIFVVATHLKPRELTEDDRARSLRLFPTATADLLDRATAARREDRFESAPEMAGACQRALHELDGTMFPAAETATCSEVARPSPLEDDWVWADDDRSNGGSPC